MPTTINLTFAVAAFPVGWNGDLNQYAQALAARLTATISGQLLFGLYSQTPITLPTTDQGPIAAGRRWYFWDNSLVTPAYNPEFKWGTTPTSDMGPILDPSTSYESWLFWDTPSNKYIPAAPPQFFRSINVIDNGDFSVCQRFNPTVGLTNVANLQYSFDRYITYVSASITGQLNIGSSAGPPASQFNPQSVFAMRCAVGATQASVNANDILAIAQRLELQRAVALFGINPSFSIWLRPSIAGTYCIFIRDAGSDQSIVYDCLCSTPNVWSRFTFPAIPTFPSNVGNWGTNPTDFSMEVGVCLQGGATFQVTSGQRGIWQLANRVCSANQVNWLANAGATLDICFLDLETSNTVSQFPFVPFEDNIQRCRRYFCKSYAYGKYAGDTTDLGSSVEAPAVTSTACSANVKWPVRMRATPSPALLYSPSTGATSRIYDLNGAADRTFTQPSYTEVGFIEITSTTMTASLSGFAGMGRFHYTASADL